MNFNLILAAFASIVLLIAMDYFRFGKAEVKNRLSKYVLSLITLLVISFFINKPVMQYFILVLGGIGIGRVFIGMQAVANDNNTAKPLAYGSVLKPKTWTGGNWFHFMVAFAFASVISFCQINSYWADQHNFNGFFGWLGIGIVLGLIAVFGLYKTIINSNTGTS